jgi:hypothetical protein
VNTFWKFAPWISRLILLLPTAIFIMVGVRHLAQPAAMAAAQGFAFTSPVGPTVFRAALGGFPLGCAAFLIYCLASNRRTLTGLIFSTLLVGIILVIRIYAMEVGSSVQQSMPLVISEIVLVVISLVGIAIENRRRSYASRTIPSPGAATVAQPL